MPQFGTSGVRGLVSELTPEVVASYVRAFLATCDAGPLLFVGHDLRDSSPGLARVVAGAAAARGCEVVACGALPTPALALAAQDARASAIMVTGSHIPADRNGLKFYSRRGEVTKADEAAMRAALDAAGPEAGATAPGAQRADPDAAGRFVARYVRAVGPDGLRGMRVGLWAHSAVGRDLLALTLGALGAEVVEVDRSDRFVPVDTEAVDEELRARLRGWAAELGLDAVASTDGDSDRPLLVDATGRMVPGDVLGQVAAAALGADIVVTPISSNTGVELSGRFATVVRTRIGSPFVIAGMRQAVADDAHARVVGYEANGGFLLGFDAAGPAGPLPALWTRDAFLPLVLTLAAARGRGLAALVAAEPARFTAAGRLQDVPAERAAALVAGLGRDGAEQAAFVAGLSLEGRPEVDRTDGTRLRVGSRIVHVRASGNAPELRLYVEAESPEVADALLRRGLGRLRLGLP